MKAIETEEENEWVIAVLSALDERWETLTPEEVLWFEEAVVRVEQFEEQFYNFWGV